ncbi:MAG: peptidase [Caulobacter sp.]|nr:peptidase [Caulobacter sp.]
MKLRYLAVLSAVALSFLAPIAQASGGRYGEWGVDLSGGDTSVKPGDSFFEYVNGAWAAKTKIPRDGSGVGVDYDLRVASQIRIYEIIQSDRKADATDPDAAKVRDFYASFLDSARVEALDAQPLQPALARINAAKDRAALALWMGHTMGAFGGSIFGADVEEDARNPGRYTMIFSQGGTWLPDRDYYLSDKFATQRAAYLIYVTRTLTAIGWPHPESAAKAILAMETKVAEVSWPITDRQDGRKTYNPMSISELEALAPAFPWKPFMKGLEAESVQRVVVKEKSAFPKIAAIYAATPLDTLKAWAAFTTVDQGSQYLSKRFVDSRFDFQDRTLGGVEGQNEREDQAVQAVDQRLSDAIGRQYVDRYFSPESRTAMQALAGNLKAAMAARLKRADWMAPTTKAEALEKLSRMRVMVGYPSHWRDYSGLVIDPGDLYGNMERSNEFEWRYNMARLDRPIDPEEWDISPQTVNAYNNPIQNVVVFPAAILQPPYFNPNADLAVNYGAIGAVIGHEITHGFDNDGRNYDSRGVLRDWWQPADAARFDAEAEKLAAQFDKFEGVPGAFINGHLTIGENIADLGGMLMALEAYHDALGGKPAPIIDGLTGDQRFFLAWGQAWRTKERDDALRQQMATDGHSPARFRVDGPTRNIDEWYTAFDVKPGDKMYLAPKDRVRIW